MRIGRRQAVPSRVEGVENVAVDVRDADAVARAAEGASVVYHCVNPLYQEWPEMLLPMTRGIVDGAARARARLVVLDNLYMYGDTSHMTEESPMAPVSKKGALRVQAAELLLDADARGRVPVVALGREAARGVWMMPVQPAETSRAVLDRFGRAMGTEVRISQVPLWVLRAAGIFWRTGAEIAEMTYQWRQPYFLDDSKFRARFGVVPTPWDVAVRATVAWGRAELGDKVSPVHSAA